MNHSRQETKRLPAGARVEPLFPNGVRLVLPRHQPGALRLAAFLFAVAPVTLFMTAGAVMCFLSAFGAIELAEDAVSRWWFLPFGLFFGAAATGLLLSELYTFLGHVEIELDESRVTAIGRVGPLRWATQCPLRSVTKLNVPDSHSAFGWERNGGALVAERTEPRGEDAVVLARNYPNQQLLQLAEWLSEQINRRRLRRGDAAVEAVSETTADRLQQPLSEQPAESRIRVQSLDKGIVLRIPPTGLLRYGGGVGATCGVMCLGMVALGSVAALNLDLGLMIGLLALSVLIGLLTFLGFLYGLNGGLRRTVLIAAPDRLKLEQTAPFGSRERQWPRDRIEAIALGPSRFATTIHRNRRGQWSPASSFRSPQSSRYDQQQIPELRIHVRDGDSWGLFAGRDEDELRWLATVLQQQLQVAGTKADQHA